MFRRLFLLTAVFIFSSVYVGAHCDGLDGPVVKAAQKALETGNVNYVLIWVNEKSEPQIKETFAKALEAKKLEENAKKLAHTDFYGTLIKLHREAEGEEFTGVKPAGRYAGTVIPLADEAVESNSMEPLSKALDDHQMKKLKKYFEAVIKNKGYDINDVPAGRKYVSAYVEFFHHLEHLTHNVHEKG